MTPSLDGSMIPSGQAPLNGLYQVIKRKKVAKGSIMLGQNQMKSVLIGESLHKELLMVPILENRHSKIAGRCACGSNGKR